MLRPLQNVLIVCLLLGLSAISHTNAALEQKDEQLYLNNFNAINAASYAAIDDPNSNLPSDLLAQCKKGLAPFVSQSSFQQVTVIGGEHGTIKASDAKSICDEASICTIPEGVTLLMDDNLNVGALIVRGAVEWNDDLSPANSFLCAGYIAIEEQGSWTMKLESNSAWIYLKDNGTSHVMLRSRSFGGAAMNDGDDPLVSIEGRQLERTWSLLSKPLVMGDDQMVLMHDPALMGWREGDRIGIAPTERLSTGTGEEFRIKSIDRSDGTITLDKAVRGNFDAEFAPPVGNGQPRLKSAEVINLDRNIVITGDDFTQVACDPNLPEAVAGEETSVLGCRCASFRTTCTMGLHTIQMHGGLARIQNTRVEKCGQRGVEGKYCLHFHKLHDCPDCLFKNNAVENSQQRGIIVHGTHRSQVENNVLYNVRGAGIYIEDGNEMANSISYNVIICNFPFKDQTLHGCTVPGTSNRIADTSDNQAGIFSRAATNNLIGNRSANSFNGMLLSAGGIGRGSSRGKVCEPDSKMGRIEGNTFHGNGRFGTYTLGSNYPKLTDQSIATDGHNIDQSLCEGFDNAGNTRGISAAFQNNVDYHNAFVGHYMAGDLQYNGHQSYDNDNLIYWKETKNFENGCSAHITGGNYAQGNMAFPDVGTFIVEDTTFGDDVTFEPNHHCNVGTTGVLCMPQYVLHHVDWMNKRNSKWVRFQSVNNQPHNANQNHGGIFTLSPSDAMLVMQGQEIENSFFPPGYVSLVSSKFSYLLSAPDNACVLSSEIGYGTIYDNGILCKLPLRSLKVYSRGLVSHSAPQLRVDVHFNNGGIDASQNIGFHQTGADNQSEKQGYSLPVIPGTEHSYSLSLLGGGGNIPNDWVIEFSDVVIGNRWNIEYIYLSLQGRTCGDIGLVSSHHDRKFIWSGTDFMRGDAWGNHGACVAADAMPKVDCAAQNDGVMPASSCPELCDDTCNEDNSYCDCGSNTCRCKAGFMGHNCSIDLCEAARCGEHGTCAARYLGSSSLLPVTSEQACICDAGWAGPLCTFNPCLEQGKTCSGNGQCLASGIYDAVCSCDSGFSGHNCETSCDDVCPGIYPFGCSENVDGAVKYGCNARGGCNYPKEGKEFPSIGYCTYKSSSSSTDTCQCEGTNECQLAGQCMNRQCSEPAPQHDLTPCNSVPFGVCISGICASSSGGPSPSPPTLTPSGLNPTPPSPSPLTPSPSGPNACGCTECTDAVLNAIAGDYSCRARISWLQSGTGGSKSEEEACIQISRDEYSGVCGPMCDPSRCDKGASPEFPSVSPTVSPTLRPSASSTSSPTISPTSGPTPSPTSSPTSSPPTLGPTKVPTASPSVTVSNQPSASTSSPCGCDECTDAVLNTMAGDYTCGARINWLQTVGGGSRSEEEACIQISGDFDGLCGPKCDPVRCEKPAPSPTVAPSSKPTVSIPSPCGCKTCTNEILNTMAGDHTCGARINWLQSALSRSEVEACIQISGEEFGGVCGPMCDPNRCNGGRRYLRSNVSNV